MIAYCPKLTHEISSNKGESAITTTTIKTSGNCATAVSGALMSQEAEKITDTD